MKTKFKKKYKEILFDAPFINPYTDFKRIEVFLVA